WLDGSAPVGVSRDVPFTPVEASLSDASPASAEGVWSESFLTRATALLTSWVETLLSLSSDGDAAGASLEASVQEILVRATDRDPARDTRTFGAATLRASVAGTAAGATAGQGLLLEETRSASTLAALEALSGRPAGHPAATLALRCRRSCRTLP